MILMMIVHGDDYLDNDYDDGDSGDDDDHILKIIHHRPQAEQGSPVSLEIYMCSVSFVLSFYHFYDDDETHQIYILLSSS